jgi:hypothetical protein
MTQRAQLGFSQVGIMDMHEVHEVAGVRGLASPSIEGRQIALKWPIKPGLLCFLLSPHSLHLLVGY